VVVLGLFGWRARRVDYPILDLKVLGPRIIWATTLVSFMGGVIVLGLTTYVPIYAQGLLGATAHVPVFAFAALCGGVQLTCAVPVWRCCWGPARPFGRWA